MKIILYLLSILCICSCDCFYDYEYQMQNNSSKELIYTIITNVNDSITLHAAAFQQVSFVASPGLEGKCPKLNPIDASINELTIISRDSLKATTDFLITDNWTYKDGLYKITITDNDF